MPLPDFHSPHVERFSEALREQSHERVRLPIVEKVSAEAHDIASEIAELTSGWNAVELYTADNVQSERERFFEELSAGNSYQPQFTYSHAYGMNIEGAEHTLRALRDRIKQLPEDTREQHLTKISLLSKVKDDLATCDLVRGIQSNDDAMVGRGLTAKYPKLDEPLLQFATNAFDQLLRNEKDPDVLSIFSEEEKHRLNTMIISPEEQVEAFTWALKQYGILREGTSTRGFRIKIDPQTTAIDVRGKSAEGSMIFVPQHRDEPMTAAYLCTLIAHEIEGHARQAINGEILFRLGGGVLSKDDETLYEGLAMRYELDFKKRYFGEQHADLDATYFYVFAVQTAEQGGSFTDIFQDQLERRLRVALKLPYEFPVPSAATIDPAILQKAKNQAWRTTYRVMRGHVDTSNPHKFAMAKDLSYLRGWLMDKQLIENGHGHVNEAAIVSLGGLQALTAIELKEEDLPLPFQDIAPLYARMLLARKSA